MSQQVQELIDKIKSEGIQNAEEKGKEIEEQAKANAKKIVDDANSEAEQIILNAKEDIKRMKESTHMSLKQSARDMILSLRKEIEHVLQKIISESVNDSLTPENLTSILTSVIKESLNEKSDKSDVLVSVNAKDLDKLKNGSVAKLQKQVKQSIQFQAANDIGKGFTISFDKGKSSFDFSDQSLAEFLGAFLNEHVSSLVVESMSSTPAAVTA